MVMYSQQIVKRCASERVRGNFGHCKEPIDTNYSYWRITPENTKDILASEVSGIAVMSGIVSSSNPYSKAKSYKESIRKWAEKHV